ncbi:helix-turn-helix domain-containing protein [Thauera aminoaromatica]
MVSLGIPVAGGGAGMYCGVPIQDGAVSWLPGGGDFEIFSRERMDIVSATVSESLLCGFAASDSPRTAEASLQRPFLQQQPRRAGMLRRALIEIVVVARRQPGLLEIPASRAAMRDCVLSLMLDTLDRASERPTADLRPSVKAWIVRKVRELALERPSEPLQIADICRSLAVSRRSLQYAFEDLVGMGAVEFLRNVRLNAVRRELRVATGSPDEPIAAIAARWGFWHMPRFAAYYRALFGELPSETRRREGGSTPHGPG